MSTLDDAVRQVVREELAKLSATDPLVSCIEAGIPRKTWIKACRSGALAAVRCGRELRARRSDVDAWIATLPSAKTETTTEPADEPADPLDRLLAHRRLLRPLQGGRR